jgi:hypothetical protein
MAVSVQLFTMDPAIYTSVFTLLLTYFIWRWNNSKMLPPGPRPLPLIGNMLDLTAKELWLRAHDWGKKYGQIMLSFIDNIY